MIIYIIGAYNNPAEARRVAEVLKAYDDIKVLNPAAAGPCLNHMITLPIRKHMMEACDACYIMDKYAENPLYLAERQYARDLGLHAIFDVGDDEITLTVIDTIEGLPRYVG